jgi:protein phosphatase
VVRERNEDAAYIDPERRFVVLADGMGGHGHGDVAAAMAVDVARTCLESGRMLLATFAAGPSPRGRQRIRSLLGRAVKLANEAVLERARREPDKHGMGSTLEVVVLAGGEAFVAHVGDSRSYLMRGGEVRQLTRDHTMAEVMRRAGSLSDEDARMSPMRSVLSNAIGAAGTAAVDHVHVKLEAGDRLLICSDGLYDYFTPRELGAGATIDELEEAVDKLIADARAGGGHDNITGILIAVDAPDAHSVDPLEDVPTAPISIPVPFTPAHPMGAVSEHAIDSIVDSTLRETSGPIPRP